MNNHPLTECPKCHYIRQRGDTAPDWRCPRCGIAYEKFATETPLRGGDHRTIIAATAREKTGGTFKAIRIFVLMTILILVGANTWLAKLRATGWDHPLRVVVYPINGDGSAAAARYIAGLDAAQFAGIEASVKEQAAHYGIAVERPMAIALAQPVAELPPLPPRRGNMFEIMWWSLELRWWAAHWDHYDGPTPEVRAFTLYYDPKTHPILEHSTALEKGMIGVIKLFASEKMAEQNDIVLLHELLHTLGATDKYDLRNNQPLYPDGYAEPDLRPRLPQRKAEIMAGRIPLSETRAEMPERLADVVVGAKTAREIGWIK